MAYMRNTQRDLLMYQQRMNRGAVQTSAPMAPTTPTENDPIRENGRCGQSLAMVYSPYQRFEGLYEPAEALKRGTIFQALDLPFTGRRNG